MNYIFDFDGVLADTFEPYVEFIQANFFLSREMSINLIMKHTLRNDKPKMFERMLEKFNMEKLEKFLATKPGILFKDRLDQILELQGSKCILSRNYTEFVKDIMHDYTNIFEPILGFNDAENKTLGFALLRDRYSIDLQDSIFVTDTVGDILEAKQFFPENRIFAVDWGFNTPEQLSEVIIKSQIISNIRQITF